MIKNNSDILKEHEMISLGGGNGVVNETIMSLGDALTHKFISTKAKCVDSGIINPFIHVITPYQHLLKDSSECLNGGLIFMVVSSTDEVVGGIKIRNRYYGMVLKDEHIMIVDRSSTPIVVPADSQKFVHIVWFKYSCDMNNFEYKVSPYINHVTNQGTIVINQSSAAFSGQYVDATSCITYSKPCIVDNPAKCIDCRNYAAWDLTDDEFLNQCFLAAIHIGAAGLVSAKHLLTNILKNSEFLVSQNYHRITGNYLPANHEVEMFKLTTANDFVTFAETSLIPLFVLHIHQSFESLSFNLVHHRFWHTYGMRPNGHYVDSSINNELYFFNKNSHPKFGNLFHLQEGFYTLYGFKLKTIDISSNNTSINCDEFTSALTTVTSYIDFINNKLKYYNSTSNNCDEFKQSDWSSITESTIDLCLNNYINTKNENFLFAVLGSIKSICDCSDADQVTCWFGKVGIVALSLGLLSLVGNLYWILANKNLLIVNDRRCVCIKSVIDASLVLPNRFKLQRIGGFLNSAPVSLWLHYVFGNPLYFLSEEFMIIDIYNYDTINWMKDHFIKNIQTNPNSFTIFQCQSKQPINLISSNSYYLCVCQNGLKCLFYQNNTHKQYLIAFHPSRMVMNIHSKKSSALSKHKLFAEMADHGFVGDTNSIKNFQFGELTVTVMDIPPQQKNGTTSKYNNQSYYKYSYRIINCARFQRKSCKRTNPNMIPTGVAMNKVDSDVKFYINFLKMIHRDSQMFVREYTIDFEFYVGVAMGTKKMENSNRRFIALDKVKSPKDSIDKQLYESPKDSIDFPCSPFIKLISSKLLNAGLIHKRCIFCRNQLLVDISVGEWTIVHYLDNDHYIVSPTMPTVGVFCGIESYHFEETIVSLTEEQKKWFQEYLTPEVFARIKPLVKETGSENHPIPESKIKLSQSDYSTSVFIVSQLLNNNGNVDIDDVIHDYDIGDASKSADIGDGIHDEDIGDAVEAVQEFINSLWQEYIFGGKIKIWRQNEYVCFSDVFCCSMIRGPVKFGNDFEIIIGIPAIYKNDFNVIVFYYKQPSNKLLSEWLNKIPINILNVTRFSLYPMLHSTNYHMNVIFFGLLCLYLMKTETLTDYESICASIDQNIRNFTKDDFKSQIFKMCD